MTDHTPSYIKGHDGQPWEVVIGLEVHAQVVSKSKLFSTAPTDFGANPNAQVAFLDAGFPGMLPVLNTVCVDQAIRTGLGLNAEINKLSVFDRKNYFYADLPLGYQISQFERPIVGKGYLDITTEHGERRIGITRLHLETDAGKSIHDLHPTRSYIDFNRSGVALMEIVSEPDLRSSTEAQLYVKKLRTLLRYLGTCDGNMEQGSLRVDANISLRRPGAPFGTRAEIKNVNSVRFLGQAIEYEIDRQMGILESGGEIVQETRLFDPGKGETRSMRSKEDAHDYRYFPDPDLLPLRLTPERIDAIRRDLPELPDAKKHRFMQDFNLTAYDADVLTSEKETADYFEAGIQALTSTNKTQAAKMYANWLISEVFAALNRDNRALSSFDPAHLAELVDLIQDNTLSGKMAKDVFAHMWRDGKTAKALVRELGLQQITDDSAILAMIQSVLDQNPDNVAAYRSGKDKLFGFFVGQVMKLTQGKANPALVNDLLKKALDA